MVLCAGTLRGLAFRKSAQATASLCNPGGKGLRAPPTGQHEGQSIMAFRVRGSAFYTPNRWLFPAFLDHPSNEHLCRCVWASSQDTEGDGVRAEMCPAWQRFPNAIHPLRAPTKDLYPGGTIPGQSRFGPHAFEIHVCP